MHISLLMKISRIKATYPGVCNSPNYPSVLEEDTIIRYFRYFSHKQVNFVELCQIDFYRWKQIQGIAYRISRSLIINVLHYNLSNKRRHLLQCIISLDRTLELLDIYLYVKDDRMKNIVLNLNLRLLYVQSSVMTITPFMYHILLLDRRHGLYILKPIG